MTLKNELIAEFFGTFWLVFGGWAIAQLWLFRIAPIIGAALAGIVYPMMSGGNKS